MELDMRLSSVICCLLAATLIAGCGSGQRKVNKSEAEMHYLQLIEGLEKISHRDHLQRHGANP